MSSLLNNASLLLNPAGSIISYQEDKIYSVLPNNGTGDFTFSGGDGGTRVNQQGYVAPTPVNLLNNTNTFSSWNLEGGTIAGGFPDPEGGNTAYKYTSIGGNGLWSSNVVFGVAAGTGGNYPLPGSITFSFWIKSVTGNNMTANIGDGVATSGGTVNITGTWQYITRSIVPNGPWGGFYLSGLSDPTNGYYIWHPQINIGTTALPYQPTTDRLNYPRITYQNGRGALLSEPQRTNLNLYSQGFDNAYWNKQNASITASAGISPDGTNNAFKLNATATANMHIVFISGLYNGQVAVSVFAKKGEYDYFLFRIDEPSTTVTYFNLANGTVGTVGSGHTAYIEPYKDGWYRCTTVFNKNIFNYCLGVTNADNSAAPILEANKGIYIWGSQVEAGSYPTSYIPTTSATVTRPADIASDTNATSLIGQSAGTVYFDFTLDNLCDGLQTNQPVLWYMKDGGTGERYVELISGNKLVYIEYNGAVIANIQTSAITAGRHKCAIAYANNDMVFYVDGVQIGTDTSGTPSGFSTVSTQYYNSTFYGQCKVHSLAPYTTRLTNTQLTELTTVRSGSGGNISYNGPYTIHTFTGSATFTPSFNGEVEVLVVAGGGGGGSGFNRSACGGGGGAGGLQYVSSYGVSTGTGITVTIGAGGAGGPAGTGSPTGDGSNGSNSVFGGITTIGGGGGTTYPDTNGKNGGSGGGAGGAGGYTPVGGQGIPGQGNNGGNQVGSGQSTDTTSCGGGGGAGAVGANGVTSQRGGNGGIGLPYSISGFSTYYAGGGGGGASQVGGGFGGLGGGANGGNLDSNGSSGVNYTGGGGGGASSGVGIAATAGGTGGSGIVIVRYLT